LFRGLPLRHDEKPEEIQNPFFSDGPIERMILMAQIPASNIEVLMAEVRWIKLKNHLILILAAAFLLLLAMNCVPECPPP